MTSNVECSAERDELVFELRNRAWRKSTILPFSNCTIAMENVDKAYVFAEMQTPSLFLPWQLCSTLQFDKEATLEIEELFETGK